MMWTTLGFIIVVALTIYTLTPMLVGSDPLEVSEDTSFASRALTDEKERSLRAIKDLELDYAMGKLSQSDYEAAKLELSADASAVLQKIKLNAAK